MKLLVAAALACSIKMPSTTAELDKIKQAMATALEEKLSLGKGTAKLAWLAKPDVVSTFKAPGNGDCEDLKTMFWASAYAFERKGCHYAGAVLKGFRGDGVEVVDSGQCK